MSKVKKTKKKTGRPKINVDWKLIKNMCEIQCTLEEIAHVSGISKSSLQRHCKKDLGITFETLLKKERQGGLVSLRRMQFQHAQESVAMCIWLGKQYLGQQDKVDPKVDDLQSINLIKVDEMIEETNEDQS